MSNKAPSSKRIDATVWGDTNWTVKRGHLTRPAHRPGKIAPLFAVFGEKLPFECLDEVKRDLEDEGFALNGVYIAHDSMGAPRYIGRGRIFSRLRARKRKNKLELTYFSFYIVESKVHEREIETLLIRGASNMLEFNSKKKQTGIAAGGVKDFEPGATFYQRQYKKGKKAKPKKRKYS